MPRKAKTLAVVAHSPAIVPASKRTLSFGAKWDYSPAPESVVVKPDSRYDLFIGGKFAAPKSGKYFPTLNPANEKQLAEIAQAGQSDVDAAVAAARRAHDKVWGKMPGRERGKYLFRIARIIQEKARELAVLESLDGGKPIKESRDFDLPQVAAHFFYHAGWADKLAYAFPGKHPAPRRCVRADHPVEFSRCSWPRGKSRPPSRAATPVILKPAETTSITAHAPCAAFSRKPACPTAS